MGSNERSIGILFLKKVLEYLGVKISTDETA
jgi:hypothetical protein